MYDLEEIESNDMTYLTNARGISLLKQSKEEIYEVKKGIKNKEPIDMIEIELKKKEENVKENETKEEVKEEEKKKRKD